jgi:hypothetical protein
MLCEECREREGVITCPECGVLMCGDCFGEIENDFCMQCTLDNELEIEALQLQELDDDEQ